MLKIGLRLSIIILILFAVFAAAGNSAEKEVVYVYGPTCRACSEFEPFFEALKAAHQNEVKFTMINSNTPSGNRYVINNNVYYTPYLIMIKNNEKHVADLRCMFDSQCLENMYNNIMK